MKFRHLLTIAAVAAGLSLLAGRAPRVDAQGSDAQTYRIDPVHSTAIFRVHHLGAGQFYGRFNDVTGTIKYSDGSDSGPVLNVSIAVESVDTNSDRLNGHLKSPDFFNAREYPAITFKSKSAMKIKDKMYLVTGELTIHGVTQTVTVETEWTGTKAGSKGTRCGFEAIFTIKRSDFGMKYGLNGMLGDETKLIVAIEGAKQ